MRLCLIIALAIWIGGAARPTTPGALSRPDKLVEFEPPEALLDGAEYGHLYPAFMDFDGDGKVHMLVGAGGQHDGTERLLVFRNRGTNAQPVYDRPWWLDEILPSAYISDQG